MKQKNLIQMAILLLLGLGVLFSLFAFDHPGLRQESGGLELAVILRDAQGSGWSAARQGMEQAAMDLDAELRFLTLGFPNHVGEQESLILQEGESGADGLLLVPADSKALSDAVKRVATQLPVVTLEADMSESGAVACISADNQSLGETLGRMAINGAPPGGLALLLDSVPGRTGGISTRLRAAAKVLESAGRRVRICETFGEGGAEDALWMAFEVEFPDVVVAFEPIALENALDFVREMEEDGPLLYGMGATNSIARGLERGSITAIVAQNEFAVGYLAVAAAVQAVRNQEQTPQKPIRFSIIRQENMYYSDNQELLFPVTR